jgi:hypothetical protein
MNRPLSEIGAENLENPKEIWQRHTQAVYDIVDTLRERHPEVQFEACASGCGSADLGALSHFDMCWTSDNTDPLTALKSRTASACFTRLNVCAPGLRTLTGITARLLRISASTFQCRARFPSAPIFCYSAIRSLKIRLLH